MAKSLQDLKTDYMRQLTDGQAAEQRLVRQLDVNKTRIEQLRGAIFAIDSAMSEEKVRADEEAKAAADAAAAAAAAAQAAVPGAPADVEPTDSSADDSGSPSDQPANQGA